MTQTQERTVGSGVIWRLRHLAYGLPIVWGLVAVRAADHVEKPQVGVAGGPAQP